MEGGGSPAAEPEARAALGFFLLLTHAARLLFPLVPLALLVTSIRNGDTFGLALGAVFTPLALVSTWFSPVARVVELDEAASVIVLRTALGVRRIPLREIRSVNLVSLPVSALPVRLSIATCYGSGLFRRRYTVVSDPANRLLERLQTALSAIAKGDS